MRMKKMNQKPNYMTVPAAIRELEKIEILRFLAEDNQEIV